MPYMTPDTIPVATRCRKIVVPDDLFFIMAVNGQLAELTEPENWEQLGSLTPQETADEFTKIYENYHASDGCP